MRQYIKSPEEKSTIGDEGTMWPQVRFNQCPIRTSFGVLGKKWTILIIRDIGFLKINRFNRLLESIKGSTPRVLSMRLKELEKEGYLECFEGKKIANDSTTEAYTERERHHAYLDAVDCLRIQMVLRCCIRGQKT